MAEFLAQRKKEKAEMHDVLDRTIVNEFGVAVSIARQPKHASPRGMARGHAAATSGSSAKRASMRGGPAGKECRVALCHRRIWGWQPENLWGTPLGSCARILSQMADEDRPETEKEPKSEERKAA